MFAAANSTDTKALWQKVRASNKRVPSLIVNNLYFIFFFFVCPAEKFVLWMLFAFAISQVDVTKESGSGSSRHFHFLLSLALTLVWRQLASLCVH